MVLDAVRTSVMPKIIDCPDPRAGKAMLSAVACDGIELQVKARVTVRTLHTARSCVRACLPVPKSPTVAASGRASFFVATPLAAPVRTCPR